MLLTMAGLFASTPSRLEGYTMQQCKALDSRFVLPVAQPQPVPDRKITASELSKKYFIQWDDLGGSNPRQGFDACVYLTFRGDSAFISNFFGLGMDVKVKGKYNAATMTIEIAPQFVYNETPYGDFWLCPFDVQKGGFYSDPSSHFDLTIDADGNLKSGTLGWVIVVKDPSSVFYGSALGMSRDTRLKLTNATMTGNQRNVSTKTFSPTSYRVYVEQVGPSDLMIANIATNGREVHALLKPDFQWVMEPQIITQNALYTNCNYPATWTSTQNKGTNANMTGEGSANTLDFGPWGVFRTSALLQCSFGMESSLLQLDEGVSITWPTAGTISFEGEGTADNPYKIADVTDFVNLATNVNNGEKYTGKYFLQTADVDFSSFRGTYYPIGNDKSTRYFDGDFNGNGKKITNLKITRGSNQYTGLFGCVGANGYIHDVVMSGCHISSAGKYNGFIAGYCLGKINNVKTNGYLKSITEYNGGVAGYSCAVSNSSFSGQLIGNASTGGITGELHWDTVTNCHVSAAIESNIPNTVSHAVGGIVGSAIGASSGGKCFIADCYFLGSIIDRSGYAHSGGIIGMLGNNSSATRNVSAGLMTTNVTASSIGSAGGLVGSVSGGAIYDCYTSMAIQDSKETTKVGGIAGLVSVSKFITPEIRNCINTGQVRIGGIAAPQFAICGKADANVVVANSFADTQTTGIDHGEQGKYTRELTTAQPLADYDPDIWQFTEGRYPIIKNLLPANVAAFATVPATLSGNEKVTNVKNDITLALDPSILWALFSNSQYVQETDGIKIEGNKAKLKGVLSQEFLVAVLNDEALGGSFSRIYYLNVAPEQFEGSGTAEDPYLIKTVNDLKTLNKAITQNGLTYEDDYFALANDLDFSGVTDFYGVADDSKETHCFSGIFDGRNHKIKNWHMAGIVLDSEGKLDKSSRQTSALFGIVGAKGVVKNIVIDSSCKIEGHSGIASTVAICYGKIDNVRNYADIKAANNHAAGIVARLAADGASVTNCYNAGTVVCGNTYAAGIVADMAGSSTASYCQNDGKVYTDSLTASTKYSATACASGIAGVTGSGVISYCVNQGDITSPAECGGIISRASAGTKVINSVNTGLITATLKGGSLGAIIGSNRTAEAFSNVYYDGQLNYAGAASSAPWQGCTALKSTQIISGEPLEGLSTDVFDFQNGKYPVLKAFKDETACVARRSMALVLHEEDFINEMTHPATVSNGNGVQWTLSGEGFSLSGNTLTPAPVNKPGTAKLVATCNNISRTYSMQSVFVPFTGAGTQADPYRLNSFNDWKLLSEYTNSYGFRYSGKFFAMDNDVMFDSTVNYTPVAFNSANHFQGSIDGRNHKLKGVYIERTLKESPLGFENVGVIGMLGREGAVRNITLYGHIRAFKYVGGLVAISYGVIENCHNYAFVGTTNNTNTAGIVAQASEGRIVNCTNHGHVKGNYTNVGGIVSYAAKAVEIRNCANYGLVEAADSLGTKFYGTVGGVAGVADCRVVKCVNYGQVKGASSVGGVGGYLVSTDSCVNYADITVNGSMVGGVAGKVLNGTHCYNYGKISGTNYTGGVFGDVSSKGLVAYCSNHGAVTNPGKSYTGGVVGDLSTGAAIDSCANYAPVSGTGTNASYVGGVTGGGTTNGVNASRLVNYATVTVTGGDNAYYTGGVAGAIGGQITDSYNYGEVKSTSYGVGGIVGYGSGKAYRCVNLGNISTTYDNAGKKYGNAGGIWGHNGTGVFDCINYGNVSGIRYIGGIQGYPSASTKIKRVYFQGEINSSDAATTAAIMHVDATQTKVEIDSAYYNREVIGDFLTNDADQARCTPLLTKELLTAGLGDAFDYHPNALPTLKVHANAIDLNVAAAILNFKGDENANSFRTSLFVELFPGTQWSVTPNLKMYGNKIWVVADKDKDPAVITLKGNRLTRTFNLITDNHGNIVNSIDGDKEVLKVTYFTLAGIEIPKPAQGTTVIERVVYTDGTSVTRKVIVR